jgi:tRNA(Ile)-lysidine synthetase-like protein
LTPRWLESLRPYWAGNGFDPRNKTLLLAVSGGCDSIALLELFHRKKLSSKLTAVHVNHRLRPDADSDQEFVEHVCRERNIPLEVEVLDPVSRPARQSLEMWGREHRYTAFAHARKKFNADFVLTAHHRDDVVETFCLRIWRGTGFSGLAGIPFQRAGGIVRPLLPIRKTDLAEWLSSLGTTWREDGSNTDESIPRNWVRHQLLPEWRKKESDLDERIFRLTQDISGLQPSWHHWSNATYPVDEVISRGGIPMEWLRDGETDASLLRRLLPLIGIEKPSPEVLAEIDRQAQEQSQGLKVRVDEARVLCEKNGVLVSLRITQPAKRTLGQGSKRIKV